MPPDATTGTERASTIFEVTQARTSVTTSLAALRDDHIDPGLFEREPLAHGCRRTYHRHAVLLEPLDKFLPQRSESEAEERHSLFKDHRKLVLEVLLKGRVLFGGLDPEFLPVQPEEFVGVPDPFRIDVERRRHEQVDAERPLREAVDLSHLLPQCLWWQVSGSQRT
jgi:hypothetical protein